MQSTNVNYAVQNKPDADEIDTQHDKNGQFNQDADYDKLVSAAGEIGLYQIFLIFCTCPFYIFGGFAYFGQLFLTEASPNHWCWVPELENLTALDRRTLAIPLDSDARFGYLQCEMYVANWSDVLLSGARRPNQSWATQPCRNGWEFNQTEIPYPTITSELGWVCDKGSYQANAQAIFFVGSVIGGFVFGWLSDRFGRIRAAVMSNIVGCIAGILSIFAGDFTQFSICRFLMGLSYDNCMMTMYMLVLEFVAPKYRSLAANLPFGVFYTLGIVALPWIALACQDWRIISLATSLPMALALLTPFIVPESPQWLLMKGRVNEAANQIITIARVNKKEVPMKLIDQFKSSASKIEPVPSSNILHLIKRPLLRNTLIFLSIEYMCCMIIFDALVRNLGSLQFDFFVIFTLVSLTECPALVLISFILELTGRKWLSIFCLSVCCLFSFLTIFLGSGWPSVLCAVFARFTINMAASVSIQWGAEMLPTLVRGSGLSFVHICGFVATILSPYIAFSGKYISWLPSAIISVLALLGIASALVLPETCGRSMPQTFEDAEAMKRDQKMIDVSCLRRKARSNNRGQHNLSFEMN